MPGCPAVLCSSLLPHQHLESFLVQPLHDRTLTSLTNPEHGQPEKPISMSAQVPTNFNAQEADNLEDVSSIPSSLRVANEMR